MEDNFAIRLKVFMDSTGMSSSQFADLCEIPRPSFSQLLSGRNQKVSDVLIGKIHSAFPDLSVTWLMFGEGEMLQSKHPDYVDDQPEPKNPSAQSNSSDPSAFANEYENLTPLTHTDGSHHHAILQQLEESKKILELQQQIEKMQKNPRKVIQVTVYYDDSTYETFSLVK